MFPPGFHADALGAIRLWGVTAIPSGSSSRRTFGGMPNYSFFIYFDTLTSACCDGNDVSRSHSKYIEALQTVNTTALDET